MGKDQLGGDRGDAGDLDFTEIALDVIFACIAPVTPQLILSHIAERVLGLPKSY